MFNIFAAGWIGGVGLMQLARGEYAYAILDYAFMIVNLICAWKLSR